MCRVRLQISDICLHRVTWRSQVADLGHLCAQSCIVESGCRLRISVCTELHVQSQVADLGHYVYRQLACSLAYVWGVVG